MRRPGLRAPVRWMLERIAKLATRDERLDKVEAQLRAAIARAEKAEREADTLIREHDIAIGAMLRQHERAEKAEATVERWRPVVEAAAAESLGDENEP